MASISGEWSLAAVAASTNDPLWPVFIFILRGLVSVTSIGCIINFNFSKLI